MKSVEPFACSSVCDPVGAAVGEGDGVKVGVAVGLGVIVGLGVKVRVGVGVSVANKLDTLGTPEQERTISARIPKSKPSFGKCLYCFMAFPW